MTSVCVVTHERLTKGVHEQRVNMLLLGSHVWGIAEARRHRAFSMRQDFNSLKCIAAFRKLYDSEWVRPGLSCLGAVENCGVLGWVDSERCGLPGLPVAGRWRGPRRAFDRLPIVETFGTIVLSPA